MEGSATRRWKGIPGLVGTLALAGATVAVGARLVPPRMDHHALQDAAHEQVTLAGAPGRTEEAIRHRLWQEVVELGLDAYLDESDIVVEKGSSKIRIHVEYVRPVEILGYTYDWRLVVHETGVLY